MAIGMEALLLNSSWTPPNMADVMEGHGRDQRAGRGKPLISLSPYLLIPFTSSQVIDESNTALKVVTETINKLSSNSRIVGICGIEASTTPKFGSYR